MKISQGNEILNLLGVLLKNWFLSYLEYAVVLGMLFSSKELHMTHETINLSCFKRNSYVNWKKTPLFCFPK